AAGQKERNVHAQPRRQFRQPRARPSESPQPIETPEGGRGVARAAPQTRRHRDPLPQPHPRARLDAGNLTEQQRRADDQVALVGGERGIVRFQRDGRSRLQRQPIEEVHRLHHGRDLVIAVRSLAQDLERQVDLGRGLEHETTGASRPVGQGKSLPRSAAKCQRKSWILTRSGTASFNNSASKPTLVRGARYFTTTCSLPSGVVRVTPAGAESAAPSANTTRAGLAPPVHSAARARPLAGSNQMRCAASAPRSASDGPISSAACSSTANRSLIGRTLPERTATSPA